MSERPTYTLHAVKSEEVAHFGRVGVYAYRLTGPAGYLEQRTSDPKRPVQLGEDLDTLYAAAIDALQAIPEDSHLHVVSKSQHHHGKPEGPGQYRGTFNITTAEREASGYTDKNGKGFIANVDQVKEMDGVLKARHLTTSGEHWRKGQDQALYTTLFQRAHATMQKASMIANGVEPPEDY